MIAKVLQEQITTVELHRVAKLPAWALNLMEKLARIADLHKQELDEAQSALAAMVDGGNERTTTWVDPFGTTPIAVGTNPDVRHKLANGDEMVVTFGTKGVAVTGTGAGGGVLLVQPVVANEVRIVPAGRLVVDEEG